MYILVVSPVQRNLLNTTQVIKIKLMLLSSNIFYLIINAVTFRRESLFSFSRVAIMIFLTGSLAICGLILTCIGSGLGIYNGLFHSTVTTQSFDLFIYIIGAMILLLTGFSPRRTIEPFVKPVLGFTSSNFSERGLGLKNLYYRLRGTVEYKKIYEK